MTERDLGVATNKIGSPSKEANGTHTGVQCPVYQALLRYSTQ